MVALVTRETDTARSAQTPVGRIRAHLHLVTRPGHDDRQLRTDLRTLVQRLRGVQARGGALAGVELGPRASELTKTLELVGNEILVLDPERKRA